MRAGVVARKRPTAIIQAADGDEHDEVISWYREQLAEPAVFPWAGARWEPSLIGHAWQTTDDGHWALPEATLGWDALGFAGCWLQHRDGVPWRYTLEQARIILWWYSLDEQGRFHYHDGVIQRLKGWGKDPFLSTLCAIELIGPCRFAEWDGDRPVAKDVDDAWIPIAAVALAQTKTTFRLFPGLFSKDAMREFGVVPGKEMVYAYGDSRMIQAVTSSPSVLEGIRPSFTGKNETQHWGNSNGGHDMAAVIERNATKSADGASRTLGFTNAPDPSEESVGLADREAWELSQSGGSLTSGIMYDSLEAAPDAPLTAEDAGEVLRTVRGDSSWLDEGRIVKSILDTRNPPSRSRRFWYNQIHATEDAWSDPQDFDRLQFDRVEPRPQPVVDGDQIAMFFDGSKSDDATGLVGCRISDGFVSTLGMWQKPPKERGALWTAPRAAIDAKVDELFERYDIVAFFADPSHTRDDETQERYWDETIDGWHRRYKDRLKLWAVPGAGGHSVMWDMASPARASKFTAAAERCAADIEDKDQFALVHDGDRRLVNHVRNAKQAPGRLGTSLRKEHRESPKKIDLAVCMVGARMARRDYLNSVKAEKKRSGVVW